MGPFLAFLLMAAIVLGIVKFATRRATFPERQELAALRALIDRIDTLADDARDIKTAEQANAYLSVQILDEIRAHRRRSDAATFHLPAAERSTPLAHLPKKQRDRLARSIGRRVT